MEDQVVPTWRVTCARTDQQVSALFAENRRVAAEASRLLRENAEAIFGMPVAIPIADALDGLVVHPDKLAVFHIECLTEAEAIAWAGPNWEAVRADRVPTVDKTRTVHEQLLERVMP